MSEVNEVYVKSTIEHGWNAFKIAWPENDKVNFVMPFCGLGNPWNFGMWSPDPPTCSLDFMEKNYIKVTEEEFNEKYKQKILDSKKETSEDIIAERKK